MAYAADRAHDAIVHPTKQHAVYTQLRDDIISCRLAPGNRLRIDELANRFAVSIIPVREALRALESEGLVSNVPHVGAAVSPIDSSDIFEALTIMEGLETVSARAATERASEVSLGELERRLTSMDQAIASQRPDDWVKENRAFHLAIARIAAMPLLREMLTRAFDRWERVWRFHFAGVATRRIALAQAEHQDIVRHMRARDLPAVEEVVRQHNRAALTAYLAQHARRNAGDLGG